LEVPLSYKNVPHKERVSLVCDTLDRSTSWARRIFFQTSCPAASSSLWGLPEP